MKHTNSRLLLYYAVICVLEHCSQDVAVNVSSRVETCFFA